MDDRTIDLRDEMGRDQLLTDTTDSAVLARRVGELEVENAELRLQLAVLGATDPATGLANRIGLLDAIEMATYRLERMNEPFAVVLLSFPQLEQILQDDVRLEAIRDVGSVLAAGVRAVDKVGRMESSTFISVLANIPRDSVDVVLGRTRESLNAVGDKVMPRILAVSLGDSASALAAGDLLDRCQELINDDATPEIVSI